jgi:hypothetical protein
LTASIAQFVVSIHDGKVTSQGSIDDALRMDSSLLVETLEEKNHEEQQKSAFDPPEKYEFDESGKLVIAEDIAEGQVGMSACKLCSQLLGLSEYL